MRKIIRKFLRLDGWGFDIYRLKRRMGDMVQEQKLLNEDMDDLVETVIIQQDTLASLMETIQMIAEQVDDLASRGSPGSQPDSQPEL